MVPLDKSGRVLDSDVVDRQILHGTLPSNETTPCLVAFMDDLGGVFLVLGFTRESEGIFGLAIGDLVDTEPFICGPDQTREVTLHILDVIELGSEGILNIHDNDLPIGLAFIEQSHDTKNFDLLHLADIADLLPDFTNIERIVVALRLGLSVGLRGILPGLGEGSVIPDVSVVREAVAHETQPALLDILFNGIEGFLLGNLHLRVRPARNLDDHVEDAVVLVCEERDVVERRDDGSILFDVDTVFKSIRRADEAGSILWI